MAHLPVSAGPIGVGVVIRCYRSRSTLARLLPARTRRLGSQASPWRFFAVAEVGTVAGSGSVPKSRSAECAVVTVNQ